jgi:uncharacterized membrane-anchored protein
MKKTLLLMLTTLLISFNNYGQEVNSTQLKIDEIEKSLKYKTGVIELESGSAKLTVPDGFRYLDKAESMYVLTDLWGNPADSSILGMLVPVNRGLLQADGWAFTISYDEMGYVKDDDAADINYDDLLQEQQKETKEENPERIKQGYQPIEFIGWASHPYYDKDRKILHWAKELKFGADTLHTLNYNLRVLGRKGIFMLNAVASMRELPEVKSNINKVIGSVEFKEGSKYADFNPEVDEVAAWSIGGLVAGKILAKVGFFALLLKFWKIIAFAILAASGTIWKFIRGKMQRKESAASIED